MRAIDLYILFASVSACGSRPEPEIIEVTATVMDDSAVFEWGGSGPMHAVRVLACDLPICACDYEGDSGYPHVTGGVDISWDVFQRLAYPADPPVIAPPVLYGDPMAELGLGVGVGPHPLQSQRTYAVIPHRYAVCDEEGDCFVDKTGCAIFHMP